MSMDLRLPNITATTAEGQLQQVKSYLYQVVEQLNWALKNISAGSTSEAVAATSGVAAQEKEATSTFNNIKSLIIKSAEIVNAYYEVINRRLEGLYVAESDFGTYSEATTQAITENSTQIENLYTNIQEIISQVEGIENSTISVNAHIRTGLLYYDDDGAPVYGMEIGQKTEINGAEVFNKYARFTSGKLSFYDQNDSEVAYISDYKLHITHAEITGSLKLGGFKDTVLSNSSVVTRWIGTGGEG